MAFSLRLPPELDLRLRAAAAERYMSLNTLIVQALAGSPYVRGVQLPSAVREPGKLFSEAEALAISKSPVVGASVAPAKPSKAETRAYMEQKRLSRRG
jgi:predicted transcriptional regulator